MNLKVDYGNLHYIDPTCNSLELNTANTYSENNVSIELLNTKLYSNEALAIVIKPSYTRIAAASTGHVISNGYSCSENVIMTGENYGVVNGTYIATYTPAEGYTWEDNTTTTISITLVITGDIIVLKPINPDPVNYDGNEHTNGYNCPTGVSISSDSLTKGTNGGTYTASYTPQSGYAWDDGTLTTITLTLTILYVWNKYKVVTLYTHNISDWIVPFEPQLVLTANTYAVGIQATAASSVDFNSSTGYFTITPASGLNYMSSTSCIYINQEEREWFVPYYLWTNSSVNGVCNSWIELGDVGGCKVYSNGIYEDASTGMLASYRVHSSVLESTKGDYVGQVTNTSNIYPENGVHTDGYWYVKTW